MSRIPTRVPPPCSASATDGTEENPRRRPNRSLPSAITDAPPPPLVLMVLAALMIFGAAAGANCQSIKGIYALGSDTRSQIPRAVLENPNVDGIALRYAWDDLEPAEGTFDWTRVDRDVARAQLYHKKVSLSVTAGVRTPHWVYAAGAAPFTFAWDKTWGFSLCSRQSIPVPWNTIYLSKWKAFVRGLGHRYAASPAVICIKLTGVNGPTQETQLPHSGGAQVPHGRVICPGADSISDWVAAGYTRSKVDRAWLGIADTFAQSFPNQRLALMISPRAFPPIDDSGHVISHKAADMKLTHELINEGRTRYGARCGSEQWSFGGSMLVRVVRNRAPCDRRISDALGGHQGPRLPYERRCEPVQSTACIAQSLGPRDWMRSTVFRSLLARSLESRYGKRDRTSP